MIEDDLNDLLEVKGITFEDDSEFNNLLQIIKADISRSIGVPLEPSRKIQLDRNFNGLTLVVDYYPIHEINNITIDGREVSEEDYTVDSEDGIIYFNNTHQGLLKLDYCYCLSKQQYENLILPLILDMFEYIMDTGWSKNASSIHEGDISITLDTSLGKGAIIQKQLDNLKNDFSTIGRLI